MIIAFREVPNWRAMGFLLTSFNIFFQMHFVSTRVGRWDVNDDYDDDVCDDDEDYDDVIDDDDEDYDDDIGAQVSEYDDYEYELKKEGVSEERTDGAYISVKYIPPICHLYHLWDLWTKILRKLSRCWLVRREQEWIQFVPNMESATQGWLLLMLIIIEIFRSTIIILWRFWS